MPDTKAELSVRIYLRFLFLSLSLIAVGVGYVGLQSRIVSDRTMGFQHQLVRYQSDLINGKYPQLESLDVLVIGDSTAGQNLLPTEFTTLRAASLAAFGVGAIENYYILKRYLEADVPLRTAPKCVLFMTSYGAQQYHLTNFFWPLTVGHELITASEVMDIYRNSATIRAWPSSEFSLFEYANQIFRSTVAYRLQFGTLNQMLTSPNLTFVHSQRSYRLFRRNHGAGPMSRRPSWLSLPFDGPNHEFLRQPFQPDPMLDLYIKKIVELTNQENIRLFVAYGPIAESVRSPVSEEWLQRAASHISGLIGSSPNVTNLLSQTWFPDSQFTDATHLKWDKAMEFSKSLSGDLQGCLQNR